MPFRNPEVEASLGTTRAHTLSAMCSRFQVGVVDLMNLLPRMAPNTDTVDMILTMITNHKSKPVHG